RIRDRGQGAPHLLGQHAERLVAQAEPAIAFRDGGCRPAKLCNGVPERPVERLLALEDPADGSGRTAVVKKAAGLVTESVELLREIEIHGFLLLRFQGSACSR